MSAAVRSTLAVLLGAAGLVACAGPGSHSPPVAGAAASACNPVIMVVAGVTLDAERMAAYQSALTASGLYPEAGGYYLNLARPLAVFEGDPPEDFVTVAIRFPSLEAARAFWTDPVYQDVIKPMRETPSAGDYTVTVYAEAALPAYMAGRVTRPDYIGCPQP
ncbi:MAG: DUF1330 domain-containing protein [Oceanicaulis sp.]